MTELKADDVGASLKVGHGQVERSVQRGNGDRMLCPWFRGVGVAGFSCHGEGVLERYWG